MMFGWRGIASNAFDFSVIRGGERREKSEPHLDFLEFPALIPTAFPLLLHAFDGNETHIRVLWPRAGGGLHCCHWCIGG